MTMNLRELRSEEVSSSTYGILGRSRHRREADPVKWTGSSIETLYDSIRTQKRTCENEILTSFSEVPQK
jgi:hypothetical protein